MSPSLQYRSIKARPIYMAGLSCLWKALLFLSALLLLSSTNDVVRIIRAKRSGCSMPTQYNDLTRRVTDAVLDEEQVDYVNLRYSSDLDCTSIKDPLSNMLCLVESFTVFYTPHSPPLVIAKDLSVLRYYAQRDLQGWIHSFKSFGFDVAEYHFRQQFKLSDVSVILCLGIVSQDQHCLKPSSYKLLGQGHRLSQVHLMRDILWRKDGFCYTLREALNGYRGWRNFTFPCWVLPADGAKLKTKMLKLDQSEYIVKPAFRGEGHGIFVAKTFDELPQHDAETFVVQPFLQNPLLIKGKKFDLRTYVLVTSVSPLRIYFYKDGLVRFAASKYNKTASKGGKEQQFLTNTSVGKKYTKLTDLTWNFNRLKTYFIKKQINASNVFDSIYNAIVRTLLASEYRFMSDFKYNLGGYDCRNCYHLLGVDVILDDELQPFVIEVNGLPSMQLSQDLGSVPSASNIYTATKYGLMKDALAIVYGNISVVEMLADDLRSLQIGIRPGPLCDPVQHFHCIDIKTVQYLISMYREMLQKGEYLRLYPARNGGRYSRFIKHMYGIISKKLDNVNYDNSLWHSHHLFTAIELLRQQ